VGNGALKTRGKAKRKLRVKKKVEESNAKEPFFFGVTNAQVKMVKLHMLALSRVREFLKKMINGTPITRRNAKRKS
jgi:hypothetical protein